ncbi:MAG: helix-turn-helix transcriptional regulator [Acidimicrobiia bacterium]|nr:helix-turn-helix transcriptional regulator [Acidimicrobiia bacterium]
MNVRRRYHLLCPVARALDVLGDRWTLLILRDLHAGPARYQELQQGLGIATNLLSTRLTELTESGMIERSDHGYQLSEAGRRTDRVLWELTRFGAGLERDPDPKEPGNLRTLVLPLRIMLGSAPNRPEVSARLEVDDADLTIVSSVEAVSVDWGRTVPAVDVVARTSYEAIVDLSEGVISLDEFAQSHLDVIEGSERAPTFAALMKSALTSAGTHRLS